MTKYHNRKVITSDGIVFDSRRESTRWIQLRLLERAGKISNLQRQVKYVLIPSQYEKAATKKGRKLLERECAYIADFVYWDNEKEELVVEDTKGVKTKDYIIKRKLMLKEYGIKIKEV